MEGEGGGGGGKGERGRGRGGGEGGGGGGSLTMYNYTAACRTPHHFNNNSCISCELSTDGLEVLELSSTHSSEDKATSDDYSRG